jgi:pyrroline-5-carboxylate reductase
MRCCALQMHLMNPKKPTTLAHASHRLQHFTTHSCDSLWPRAQVALIQIPNLGIRETHTVLNLVSTVTNETLRKLAGLGPDAVVVKCVPLPPVALHAGVSVLYPRHSAMEALFGALGTVVCVDTEDHLRVLQAATCLMGPFYQTVVTTHEWMTSQGVHADTRHAFCHCAILALIYPFLLVTCWLATAGLE